MAAGGGLLAHGAAAGPFDDEQATLDFDGDALLEEGIVEPPVALIGEFMFGDWFWNAGLAPDLEEDFLIHPLRARNQEVEGGDAGWGHPAYNGARRAVRHTGDGLYGFCHRDGWQHGGL